MMPVALYLLLYFLRGLFIISVCFTLRFRFYRFAFAGLLFPGQRIDVVDLILSASSHAAVAIAFQEFLEGAFRLRAVVQIIAIDLRNRKQRLRSELAAGIFAEQELKLSDGVFEALNIVQNP